MPIVPDPVWLTVLLSCPFMATPLPEPMPMLDDCAKRIADGVVVSVLGETDGTMVGLIVLLPKADYLLLDNLACDPTDSVATSDGS